MFPACEHLVSHRYLSLRSLCKVTELKVTFLAGRKGYREEVQGWYPVSPGCHGNPEQSTTALGGVRQGRPGSHRKAKDSILQCDPKHHAEMAQLYFGGKPPAWKLVFKTLSVVAHT